MVQSQHAQVVQLQMLALTCDPSIYYGGPHLMVYGDRLKYWAIVRLLPSQQWVVIARFHKRSDADGYLQFLQRHLPEVPFKVVFDVVEKN